MNNNSFKIYKVRCKPRDYIISIDSSLKKDDILTCPKECFCPDKGKFTVKNIVEIQKSDIDKNWIFYDQSVREKINNISELSNDNTHVNSSTQAQRNDATNIEAEQSPPCISTDTSPTCEPKSESANTLDRFKNRYNHSNSQNQTNSPEYLTISKKIDIHIGGLKVPEELTFKKALSLVLTSWRLFDMFKDYHDGYRPRELSELFISLICGSNYKILKSEVDALLKNDNYSNDQKFFYIYYKLIYKVEKSGFRFGKSDIPLFKDRHSFIKKFIEEEQFREFYLDHKDEVHFYLDVNAGDPLLKFKEIEYANITKEVVLINNVGNSYQINKLGKIDSVVNSFTKLNEYNFQYKELLIEVLKKYRIEKNYTLVLRDSELPLDIIQCGNVDDSVLKLGFLNASSRYATELKYYLTLLKEYTSVFQPSFVQIMNRKFTKQNFSNEIEDIIGTHFAHVLSGIDDPTARGWAYFVKIIFENDILGFRVENYTKIQEYLDFLNPNATHLDVDKYFKVFNNCKIFHGNNLVGMQQFILQQFINSDFDTIFGLLNSDNVIVKYINAKIENYTYCDKTTEFEAMKKTYQDQFDNWGS